jgi:hypothetical protein
MDVTGVLGSLSGPTEWLPDSGHGTIGSAGWLTAATDAGVVPSMGSMPIALKFNSTDLLPGVYLAEIVVASNDEDDSVITVPAVLSVVETGGETTIEPDTVTALDAHAMPPATATILVGNLSTGGAADVDCVSVLINATVPPESCSLLASHPDFVGEVLEVTLPLIDFFDTYGPVFDTTEHNYTVSGELLDGTEFAVSGNVTLVGRVCGDINADGTGPDVGDLAYLTDFMFNGGPPPLIMEAANIDGVGDVIQISDLVHLVDFMFLGGPAPICE